MTVQTRWRNLTNDQWDEAVLRGRAAARAGRSLYSNPYNPEGQREQWHVWRFAYADATDDTDPGA